MKKITIYADGACSGNPGPGGWGALLKYKETEKEISGGEADTTNNRMELMAAIKALENVKQRCEIDFYTDSQYVQKGISLWMGAWKKNKWRTSSNKAIKNLDLWQKLDALSVKHKIHWHWVKGHSGHVENDRVDALARAAIVKLKK